MLNIALDKRLVVALDVPNAEVALDLIKRTKDVASHYKIGLELFASSGHRIIDWLAKEQLSIFVDLKLHETPEVVSKTVTQLAKRGVSLLSVHALGGSEMLKAAQGALSDQTRIPGLMPLTILGAAAMGHHHQAALDELGFADDVDALEHRLTELSLNSGVGGVFCGVDEVERVRKSAPEAVLACAGIRPEGSPKGAHTRTLPPYEAAKCGADYLIVGRAIRSAPDPAKMCADILSDIERGLNERVP